MLFCSMVRVLPAGAPLPCMRCLSVRIDLAPCVPQRPWLLYVFRAHARPTSVSCLRPQCTSAPGPGKPSPGADVAGVSAVPAQMWAAQPGGWARKWRQRAAHFVVMHEPSIKGSRSRCTPASTALPAALTSSAQQARTPTEGSAERSGVG